jgi:glycosyltransferase involved in cell wall biosynthesis
MTTTRPLVTIVTPVWNCREHIETCLASVLAQDYDRIEHLIIDGGSTDGTLAVLQDFAARHPGRLKYVTGPDEGPGDAWNKGVKLAAGEIIGCIGADDECEPGAVSAVAEYFMAHPDADFLHGDCRVLEDDGSARIHVALPFDYQRFVNTAIDIATTSAFYRRTMIEQLGWFDEGTDDFDVMLRITQRVKVHRLQRVLSTLRVYTGSAYNSADPHKRAAIARATYKISRRHGGSRFSRLAIRYYWAAFAAACGIDPELHIVRWLSRGLARASSR